MIAPRGHDRQHGVGLGALGLGPQRLADVLERRVDDHEHVLAGLDGEAATHDGGDGGREIDHVIGRY